MPTSRAYHTLIASLPALPSRFDVDRCPITWPRLEERLRMLEPEDQQTLTQLLDFLAWDRQPLERTDAQVVAHHRKLVETLEHRMVREIVDQRIDMRLIISALRRRRLGLGPPTKIGQWADLVRRRWNQPQFGLQVRFPWIAEFDRMLDSGAADEMERLILSTQWRSYVRAAANYHFSFEAVLLYVARWGVVNRWTSRNPALGRERFEATLSKLLESHVYLDH
ncbi:MAG: DUF2764 family protein [Aureliella sp.]